MPVKTSTGERLSTRALNRAVLARQGLLRREERPVDELLEHLVGMQAQAPFPPYYGLWTRLAGFRPEQLASRIVDRSVVRIVLMRGTVHLVTAADCLFLRPLVQPIMDRDLRTNTTYASGLAGIDLSELAAAGRKLLEEQPRSAKELGPLLARRWPDRPPTALSHGIRGLLPLVQVPPRAVWGASGQTVHTTAEAWLGRPLDAAPSLERMVLRYLAAFGPATVADMQTWSGLSRLREVVEPLRHRLRTFLDEHGRELFDLPDAPRPPEDTPTPARFLPEFDNLLLSHADRTRVMSEEHRKRLFFSRNGMFPGTLLVGGFLRGTWKITRSGDTATLTVTPYRRLSQKDTSAVAAEGARLLRFATDNTGTHDVRVLQGIRTRATE